MEQALFTIKKKQTLTSTVFNLQPRTFFSEIISGKIIKLLVQKFEKTGHLNSPQIYLSICDLTIASILA